MNNFLSKTPTAPLLFARSYSRYGKNGRETYPMVVDRCINGLIELGKLTDEQAQLIRKQMEQGIVFPSGRWLWCGGTEWAGKPENYYGTYNCSSTEIDSIESFGYLMDLAMQGCFAPGTLVLTKDGHFPIENLVGRSVEVWDGLNWVVCDNFRVTGFDKEVFEIQFNDGSIESATSDHNWMLVDGSKKRTTELTQGDLIKQHCQIIKGSISEPAAYLKGFLIGDGNAFGRNKRHAQLQLSFPKYVCESQLINSANELTIGKSTDIRCKGWGFGSEYKSASVKGRKTMTGLTQYNLSDWVSTYKTQLPSHAFNWDDLSKSQFLSGLFDADGYCQDSGKSGYSYRISNVHKNFLLDVQKLLKTLGISCQFRLVRSAQKSFMTHRNHWMDQKDLYRLDITSSDAVEFARICTFSRLKSLVNAPIGLKKNQSNQVKSVVSQGVVDEVYCCTVPTTHNFSISSGLITGNCGTGANLEPRNIEKLPVIQNRLEIEIVENIGDRPLYRDRGCNEYTDVCITDWEIGVVGIHVGDSRQGWVESYLTLIELATANGWCGLVKIEIYLGRVRPAGAKLNGFGGTANPVKLPEFYTKVANILNGAIGRKLNALECCLLIDEAALVVVAGNIRRSAGIRQFAESEPNYKIGLWAQDENENWYMPHPERDSLRMSNHTRVFHQKPTLDQCIDSVRSQYESGEGAIQWAGEAVARGNADILQGLYKGDFLQEYDGDPDWARDYLEFANGGLIATDELDHRMNRYGLNPCKTGDTMVSTDRGLIRIDKLVGKSFKALTDLRTIGLNGLKLTEAIAFPTGTQEIYEIKLKNGMSVKATANHRQFTDRGWIETKDLTAEHSICIQKGCGFFGDSTISTLLAQTIGWWYGDGYNVILKKGNNSRKEDCIAKGFVFNQQDYEPAFNCVGSVIELVTGRKPQPRLYKGVFEFRTQHPSIEKLFNSLGIEDKRTIPESFLAQGKEVLVGFLQGLFSSDGTVDSGSKRIKLVSVSRKVLSQVQLILLNLGITSSLRQASKPGSKGVPYKVKSGESRISKNNGSYSLSIYSFSFDVFMDIVGFPLSHDKQKKGILWKARPNPGYTPETIDRRFFSSRVESVTKLGFEPVFDLTVPLTHSFIANGFVTHNCGEILGTNFMCNLADVHLNRLNPLDLPSQELAFKAAAINVACLLHHKFNIDRYAYSREIDPIVGVSFTGLFDFFVNLLGVDWLRWWQAGRPNYWYQGKLSRLVNDAILTFDLNDIDFKHEAVWDYALIFKAIEQLYLQQWQSIVTKTVHEYCTRHGLKVPNRCTTVQPSGSKSLLTGASPGWHPPKAQRYIRRITFAKNDPIALAAIDYGYSVIPSQSDKDEHGNLLDDAYDPRCTEWLIEIPCQVAWADLDGADDIDISQLSALAQFDFYMQIQKHYTQHNTSATIEFTKDEIELLATRIYDAIQDDEGYISAALLARFDDHQTFPRLPFEPIDKATYLQLVSEVLERRLSDNFDELLAKYDLGLGDDGSTAAGCDSDKCLMP